MSMEKEYYIKYKSGHAGFPKEMWVLLYIYQDYLEMFFSHGQRPLAHLPLKTVYQLSYSF